MAEFGLTEVASDCRYTHVIEHVFGYGIGNASGFAQRLGNSLLYLVARRMGVVDAPFLASEADANPSCAAWLSRRRALSQRTGRNEARLYSCFIYTDDPVFQCVGFARFVRLLCCWREVTMMVGLRMAIAAKRQAGSSVLWPVDGPPPLCCLWCRFYSPTEARACNRRVEAHEPRQADAAQ